MSKWILQEAQHMNYPSTWSGESKDLMQAGMIQQPKGSLLCQSWRRSRNMTLHSISTLWCTTASCDLSLVIRSKAERAAMHSVASVTLQQVLGDLTWEFKRFRVQILQCTNMAEICQNPQLNRYNLVLLSSTFAPELCILRLSNQTATTKWLSSYFLNPSENENRIR